MLFEHKSFHDRYVHLQLLEYMAKIWRLYIRQHKKKPVSLPIVIPLLICHGRKEWPEDTVRLTSLLSGPTQALAGYIPDFGFELYDLHRFSDDQIKGTIMSRAEKLHNEGKLEGRLEGEIKVLKEAIELGITLKFPGGIDTVMAKVNKIDDLDTLKKIKEAIKTARDISEIWH